jgi:hypothetical protein
MDWAPQTIRTIDLGYEQMLLIEAHPQMRMRVLYGGIWLTEENRPDDRFLLSGDEVALKSRGLTIAEALAPSRVEVVDSDGQRAGERLRRWLAAAKAELARVAGVLPARLTQGTLAVIGALVGIAVPAMLVIVMADAATLAWLTG